MPCELAKEFLRARGIDFEAVQIEDLDEPYQAIRAQTGGLIGTPTVVIGGEARVGFDPEWMAERLGIS